MKIKTKKYVDGQVKWNLRLQKAEFAAVRQAVEKALIGNEKRLDGMNEFRGTLKDQAGTFVTRKELWGAVIAAVTIIISALTLILR